MGINFPNAPALNEVYPVTPTPGLPQYVWDGAAWVLKSDGLGPTIYVSDTAPPGAIDGALWWCSADGVLYLRYNDGDSTAWIQCTPSAADYAALQQYVDLSTDRRNRIINGAAMVSQENGAAPSTTSGYYPADMFVTAWSATGLTAQQVASPTPGGSPNRLRFTVTTPKASLAATDYATVFQCIEGTRWADMRWGSSVAKTVTLVFGCKGPAGTYCVSFLIGAETRAYIAEYTILPGEANTDVRKYVTIPGDQAGTWLTDTSAALRIRWTFGVGTTFQQAAGAWGTVASAMGSPNQINLLATNGAVFELFDIDLFEGTVARPYRMPDYATELQLSMRYWEKGQQRLTYYSGTGMAGIGTAYDTVPFQVPKRIAPTMSVITGFQFYSTADAFVNFTPNFSPNLREVVYYVSGATNWKAFTQVGVWAASARM
jgi:hypothetical protein